MFQPFRRGWSRAATARPAGSGWGSPIARNIIRAHGGEVRLVGRPGGGARAAVTLPA